MKSILKMVSAILCLAMMIVCVGCGEQPEAPTKPEEPAKVSALSEIAVTWGGKTKTYTVGSNLSIDESGRIVEIKKASETINAEYTPEGMLSKVTITKTDGKVSSDSWTYQGKSPVENTYEPNDGFRSSRKTTYTVQTDDNNRIVKSTMNNTYTDAEDGSTSTDVTENVYTYDANNVLTSVDYYSKGEKDHTTNITYDADGNITVYSNVGDNLGEYLRVEFTYAQVDASTITPIEQDGYTIFTNFSDLLEAII